MEKEGRKKAKEKEKKATLLHHRKTFPFLPSATEKEAFCTIRLNLLPSFAPAFVRSATCPLVLSTTSEYQGSDPISSSIQTRKCRGQRQETARMLQSVEHCQNGNIRGIFTQLSDKKKFRVRLLIRERPVAQGVLRPVARVYETRLWSLFHVSS